MTDMPSHGASHLTDAFALPDGALRDPSSGRWNALRLAEAMGISAAELSMALATDGAVISAEPDRVDFQPGLASIGNVLAMLYQVHGGADGGQVVRAWLRAPHAKLAGRTPLEGLLDGRARIIEEWMARAWLGDPE